MGLKFYKPTTPSRRHSAVDDFSDVTTSRALKNKLTIRKSTGGRNNQGIITVRHRSRGAKKFLRSVDFKQNRFNLSAKVTDIEYDPNRSARLMVLTYVDGVKTYALLPEGLKIGDRVMSSDKAIKPSLGNRMPLEFIPVGTMIHNLELQPGKGAEIIRSAGGAAQLMAVEGNFALIKLPSSEVRRVPKSCAATIGQLGRIYFRNIRIGRAGRMRLMGVRPTVRGKAMNPVDHPHGGGEGRHPIGMKAPKTLWGKPALGVKTRKPKKASNKFIVSRRKKK